MTGTSHYKDLTLCLCHGRLSVSEKGPCWGDERVSDCSVIGDHDISMRDLMYLT